VYLLKQRTSADYAEELADILEANQWIASRGEAQATDRVSAWF